MTDTRSGEPQVYNSRAEARRAREAANRRRRGKGRAVVVLASLVAVVMICGIGYFGVKKLFGGPGLPADYAVGEAGPEVVVQVHPGDTAQQIGAEMLAKDVVKSSDAFYNAAVQHGSMTSLQPGFYSVESRLPATAAVTALVNPESRVGALVISEGRQLHDTRDVTTGATKNGIYTLISKASCLPGGAAPKCISVAELEAAGADSDLTALGVPDWAASQVRDVPDRNRQLEGLIAAGSWDFDPTGSATEILQTLVSGSAEKYESTGIRTAGAAVALQPYQVLIAASLVERESLPEDFGKVARVIINRLAEPQKLEFDSTVNYALDTTEVATTDADRARVTPWNTYAKDGLPATPISSPSIAAVQAVETAPAGDWLYFVTIDKQGTTLFTKGYDEHLANIVKAQGSGILDSGR